MFGRIWKTRKRRVASAAATLALTASLAFAAWLTSSTGDAGARFGQLSQPTVQAAATLPGDCFPGASCDLRLTVANSNGPLLLDGVAKNGTIVTSSTSCPGTNVTVRSNADSGLAVAVASGTSTVQVPNGLAISSAAPSACQGQTISVPLTASFTTP